MNRSFRTLTVLFVLLLVASVGAAAEQLIFAVSLIRHGDRAPYAELKSSTIKHEWPWGIGELSPEGMRQEYDLGRTFRRRYVETLKLLPSTYQAKAIYALSTSVNRTVVSAQCLLAGLYPDGTGPRLRNGAPAVPNLRQPIPIMTISSGSMNIINPESDHRAEVKRLAETYAETQPDWIATERRVAPHFKRWSRILGVKIEKLADMAIPSDHVNCMVEHGVPLPTGLTASDRRIILDVQKKGVALRFRPREIGRFMAGGLLKKVGDELRAAVAGKQKSRLVLFSGHDISILGLMSALGRPLDSNPPYASHVEFELYRDGEQYFVKTFYNGEPVRLRDDHDATLPLALFEEAIAAGQ